MKQLALAAAAALALAAGSSFAGVSLAGHGKVVAPPSNAAKSICAQAGTDTGSGIASESFTDSGFSAYDSEGAGDCTVKKAATLKEVDTVGQYFNGVGPANSVDITIYADKKGKPGKVSKALTGLSFTDASGFGSLQMSGLKVKLKKAKYWISVTPSMTFLSGAGQWGWELQSETTGAVDQWQEAGGFGTGCTTWGDVGTCVGIPGDFMFTAK